MLIYPFRGILYNVKKVGRLNRVYSPPYDIISRQQQDGYYKASPYNIVRVILNRPAEGDNPKNNVYTRAGEFFQRWQKSGVLKQDEKPAVYVYGQRFEYKNKFRQTLGFIGLGRLENSPNDLVLPHEMTFRAPSKDREKLLAAVRANLSCIYTLFEDRGFKAAGLLSRVARQKPLIDVEFEGVRHRIWRLSEERPIKRLQAIMSPKKIFIADGHHRYEAAVNFRNKMRKEDAGFSENSPCNYAMFYFGSLQDKGLTILPTHRLVKNLGSISAERFNERLEDFFEVMPAENKQAVFAAIAGHANGGNAFGLYLKRQFKVLRFKNKWLSAKALGSGFSVHYRKLDVVALHKIVFDNILGLGKAKGDAVSYIKDADAAVRLVDEGRFKAAFFLNPTGITQVRDICLAGERMPHKSTYFYPKLLTGLVMRSFDD